VYRQNRPNPVQGGSEAGSGRTLVTATPAGSRPRSGGRTAPRTARRSPRRCCAAGHPGPTRAAPRRSGTGRCRAPPWPRPAGAARCRAGSGTWSTPRASSFSRWEETNTVRPSAARSPSRDRSRSRTQRIPSGSRPLTGSSRMTVAGSPSRAVAMPRRWPRPSEKRPARRPTTWPRPTSSTTASTRERAMPRSGRWPAGGGRRCGRGGPSRPPAARRPHPGARRARGRLAVDGRRPAGGGVQAQDEPHGGRLPGPVGPRNPVTLPGCTTKLRSSTATLSP
jgi:hypothetical protein